MFMNDASPKSYQLLWLLHSYLELDSLIVLNMHTERMFEMIKNELVVFGDELKVRINFASILACLLTLDSDKLITIT